MFRSCRYLVLPILILFSVAACDWNDDDQVATPVDNTTPAVPGVPAAPTLTAGNGQLTAAWAPVPGATSYEVWGSASNDNATATLDNTVTDNTCVITGLANGTPYYVWLKARNAGGAGGFGPGSSGTPVAPGPTGTQVGGSIQGSPLSLAGAVTTFAGSAQSYDNTDATGTDARFYHPVGITTDGTNLYLADMWNQTIRKIVIATGEVTTLAGTAPFRDSTDGTGTNARFNDPCGITTDGTNLYVAEATNHTIRKIVIATGVVTTIAGTAGAAGSVSAIGADARFDAPKGITTDGTDLFVADYNNHTIRRIVLATGAVTTLAGNPGTPGNTNGIGLDARFNRPQGITSDGTNLYVGEDSNHTIRKIVIATGEVTTLAGLAETPGDADGTGADARFRNPIGITTDGTNLYVGDALNHTIRKIVIATGVVTTIAGTAGAPGWTDGTGTAAGFYTPAGLTTDGTTLFVAEYTNALIRKIN